MQLRNMYKSAIFAVMLGVGTACAVVESPSVTTTPGSDYPTIDLEMEDKLYCNRAPLVADIVVKGVYPKDISSHYTIELSLDENDPRSKYIPMGDLSGWEEGEVLQFSPHIEFEPANILPGDYIAKASLLDADGKVIVTDTDFYTVELCETGFT
jgi:hypothetical protein